MPTNRSKGRVLPRQALVTRPSRSPRRAWRATRRRSTPRSGPTTRPCRPASRPTSWSARAHARARTRAHMHTQKRDRKHARARASARGRRFAPHAPPPSPFTLSFSNACAPRHAGPNPPFVRDERYGTREAIELPAFCLVQCRDTPVRTLPPLSPPCSPLGELLRFASMRRSGGGGGGGGRL